MKTNFPMIVAVDSKWGIGRNGVIPWQGLLHDDMKHFQDMTMSHFIAVGRKTFESIPEKYRPLPGRSNIIITRDQNFKAPGCNVLSSLEEVLRFAENKEVWVIGGGETYRMLLPYSNRILVTHIDGEFGCDTFFPKINHLWNGRIEKIQKKDEKNQFPFTIVEYTR